MNNRLTAYTLRLSAFQNTNNTEYIYPATRIPPIPEIWIQFAPILHFGPDNIVAVH